LATLNDFGSTPVVSVDSTDDGRVIAAAGSDGSIKVWRMSSLETESVIQATKQFKVADATRMYRMKTLRNSKSIVTGSDDRLVIYRIDSGQITDAAVAPSFKSEIHKYGHVLELETVDTDTNCIVMAACERGGVLCWDTRIANFAWDIPISPVNYSWPTGLISCKDATAFSVAFITGEVLIFDNRFLKPVRSFSISSGSITGTGHSSQSNSIWINSANDCCLFDIESGGEAKQVLTVNSSGSPPSTYPTLLPATPSFPDWNPMVKSLKSEGGSRCVIECPMGNSWTVLTGHNDGVVRYWNTDQETQTSGIAYPMQLEKPVVTFSGVHQCQRSRRDFEPSSDALNNIAGNPCQITEMHRDVVNDMCIASLQYDIIATGGRDGLVKLWK
jgi:WD40 repeat protein